MPQAASASCGVTFRLTGWPMPAEVGVNCTMGVGGAPPQSLTVTVKGRGALGRPVESVTTSVKA